MTCDDAHWRRSRELMELDESSINLNAGTLSPTPRPVLRAVAELRGRQSQAPSDFCWRQWPALLDESRAALARYLNCYAKDLLLLPNVTFAMNIAFTALQDLGLDSEILTTDHEYGAMMFALERVATRKRLRVRELKLPYLSEDPDELVQSFAGQLTDKTRAIFFSHCTTTTGLILPAAKICAAARERNILTIIDGAHAPGMVAVDLGAIDADFYGANCHKWMMAPAGCGFLYVAPRVRALIEPIITSWGYEYDRPRADEDSGWGGTFWQRDMEFHGTLDRCAQMVMPDVLDFRLTIGGEKAIERRMRELAAYARERLGEVGLTCATPRNANLSCALTAFDFPCDDLLAARDRFWNEHRIECPATVASGKTFLRVSTAWFNTSAEIDSLCAAVRRW